MKRNRSIMGAIRGIDNDACGERATQSTRRFLREDAPRLPRSSNGPWIWRLIDRASMS
jgi:hypothetical protein